VQRALLFLIGALPILVVTYQLQSAFGAGQRNGGYQNVSPQELATLLAGEDPFLLDVHVPNEGYLAGTDARIPYTEVAARIAELPTDRDARIAVYCLTGRMSDIAATDLVRLGYRNVLNLAGGMVAWRAAGLPVLPEGS
jgi:rhodanese-related sulfurtransferase